MNNSPDSDTLRTPSNASITSKLYISHFLSSWNSRLFEFGAVLFLANIYPGTLLPLSIYALVRALAAVLLSPLLGQYIDTANRLTSIRVSIIGQRSAVVLSCLLFWSMIRYVEVVTSLVGGVGLAMLSLLACVEKVCSILNTVSVERDWVVVIGNDDEQYLQSMNAQMRRIDLFCKLVGPLAIALIDGFSPRAAILTTLGLSLVSMGTEYGLIARVYGSVPALQAHATAQEDETQLQRCPIPKARSHCTDAALGLKSYIASPAFLPSFALSLLYLTVLSFSGQTTTYLLTKPSLTAPLVGVIRCIATLFELSSTWLAPYLIGRLGATRAGIWCLSWQILCLSASLSTFFYPASSSNLSENLRTYLFISTLILSRLGLYAFDLTAQLIIQNSIPSSNRGAFSSTEASLQNFFELLTFGSTIVFSRPEHFVYPACLSFGAVCAAGAVYAKYVRERRGHLLHLPCGEWGKRHWDRENGAGGEERGGGGGGRGYEMVPALLADEGPE